jgi:hypothetical protein
MVKNIGVEPVKAFSKYVLYTGFVENKPYPVSGLIVAPPEHGKSSEVNKFEMLGAMFIDKTTAFGLASILQNMTEKDIESTHHFVVLDLENMQAFNRAVREQFLAFIKQATQEGIKTYRTGNINLQLKNRKNFGFLMCTTPSDLGDKRSVFRSLSFLSRPIPFTYIYGRDLRKQIMRFIEKEEHNAEEKYFVKREETSVVNLPGQYARELDFYAKMMANNVERAARAYTRESLVGIRAKENLMTLLKAIALYDGCSTVRREHMDELLELYQYMNFEYKSI